MTNEEIREIKEDMQKAIERDGTTLFPYNTIGQLIAALEKERKENIQWQDKCLDLEIKYGRERKATERLAIIAAENFVPMRKDMGRYSTTQSATVSDWLALAREEE